MITVRTCVSKEFKRLDLQELFAIEERMSDMLMVHLLENNLHILTTYSINKYGQFVLEFNLVKNDLI